MTVLSADDQFVFGGLTGSNIGTILKEAVRRAIKEIRLARLTFEVHSKAPSRDGRPDFFTTADSNSQAIYLRITQESLPGVGFIAEEDKLFIPCAIPGREIYVVVDPLDGTKAYIRHQSSGVATQVALVEFLPDGSFVVLAAFVGDVNAGHVYGYRPGSSKVHRIFEQGQSHYLHRLERSRPLHRHNAILRNRPVKYHPLIQQLLEYPQDGGLVRDYLIDNGSFTLTVARLWIDEVGLMVFPANDQTPWDIAPIAGILDRLGFLTLRPAEVSGRPAFVREPLGLQRDTFYRPHDLVCVHASHEAELLEWVQSR